MALLYGFKHLGILNSVAAISGSNFHFGSNC